MISARDLIHGAGGCVLCPILRVLNVPPENEVWSASVTSIEQAARDALPNVL
jgi:hypothetical protein